MGLFRHLIVSPRKEIVASCNQQIFADEKGSSWQDQLFIMWFLVAF